MNIVRGVSTGCDSVFALLLITSFTLVLISSFISSNQPKVGWWGEGACKANQEGLEKTDIDFSNNRFPIGTGSIKFFQYIGEFDLFITVLNFNDRIEI